MIFAKKLLFCLSIFSTITTHGIQRNFITGHAFKDLADYVIEKPICNFNPEAVPEKSIIFIKTDFVPFFFEKVFPQLKSPVILITHNSDYSAPGNLAPYLDDPKIIKWFGQNKDIDYHPKFQGIPIGIANAEWPHGNKAVFDNVLDWLENMPLQRYEKTYINFSPNTNQDRRVALTLLKDKSFSFIASSKPIDTYLQEMAHFRYVISPFGHGLDCHRTWEALYVGCIPIVISSTLDSLYEDLPVIILNNWKDISLNFLIEKRTELFSKKLSPEKNYMNHWKELILNLK